MNKNWNLIVVIAILAMTGMQSIGQTTNFSSHVIDSDFGGPAGIFAEDINDDGFLDVICAGADANSIAWWQNNGSQPTTWTKHTVDDNFDGALYVNAADIDDDGNIDILGAAFEGDELAWWKSSGGENIEWTKYVVKESYTDAHEVMPYDIDLDGDMDIVGVSAGLNVISWFENDGNVPIGWTEHIVVSDFTGARSVDAMDIDGDGDIDLCGAALDDDEIAWWRNDGGSPINWTKFTITSDFTMSHKVQLIDIDQDGDIDILGTAYLSGISWWRNDGGETISWTREIITGNSTTVIAWALDIDLDSDNDIIASSQGSGYISYFINSGINSLDFDFNFLDHLPGAWPIFYGDFDNDGDNDIVCGGNSADEIRWYENDIITTSVDEKVNQEMMIYYNSLTNEICLSSRDGMKGQFKLQIFDNMGRNLFSRLYNSNNNKKSSFILPANIRNTGIAHVILSRANENIARQTLIIN